MVKSRLTQLERRWPTPPPVSTEPRPDFNRLSQLDKMRLGELLDAAEAGRLTPEEELDLAALVAKCPPVVVE